MKKNLISAACKSLSLLVLFALLNITSYAQEISKDPAAISAGEAVFNANCKTCHRVHQKLVGPALQDVYNRAPSIDWIKAFIKNSASVIASGDDYAVKLYNEYNKTQMTAFPLKDEDIMNVLAYIQAETEKGPEVAQPAAGPAGTQTPTDEGLPSKYLNVILVGMVLILVLLLVILGFLVSALKRFIDQKELSPEDKEIVHSPITFGSITRSPGFIFIVLFLVAAVGFKAVINGLFSIGVQQGYAPKQPIAFSHKIHAGQYEIDCKYCHVGVMKGKSAT
ncbi:MAG TPA: c-type cytochrome, partial [Chryseolinea sp.]